jgi:hypothetical protein
VYISGYTTGRSEGIDHEKERWRAELVEKKLGRWKVDPATGDSWFSIGSQ